MRKKLHFVAIFCALTSSFIGFSQRYLTPVFSSVTVSSNVVYGSNYSVLTGTPTLSSLKMDVYEPTGDVAASRPLIVLLHTGSFLPAVANGQATGSKTDSAIVEMCQRFAKRGYVAVAADYRLGWNPGSIDQDVRTGTLLQAVYRAIQDSKNCVRFFRDNAAGANTYKIDPNKIAVGGIGSGGYISLAHATLNKVAEIQLPKFINFNGSTPTPYIDQSVMGNFDGTDTAPINNPNYASYSSSVSVVFNIGGALGDSTWLDAGEGPFISMHPYKDPFAPYKTAAVIVPTTGQFVVEASGSYDVERRAKRLGNNAIFNASVYNDPYTAKANANNDGIPSLYPFVTATPGASLACGRQVEQGSPWDWWDGPTFIAQYNAYTGTTNGAGAHCNQLRSSPNMSATQGRLYIDTIQGYLNPRLVCALNLSECAAVSIKENTELSNRLSIYPNPATSGINLAVTGGHTIHNVKLFDATGRLVMSAEGLNTTEYHINRNGLAPGMYYTTVELDTKNLVTKKVMVH